MADLKTTPLYQQIFEEIKGAIDTGRYAPKERIPSESELSEEYGVSRITVRRAVEELCSEGYLLKLQGRGTFVSTPHINRRLLQHEFARSFTNVCQDNGMRPGAKLLNRQIVPARPDEAKFLKIDGSDLLLYIQRVRTADEQPVFEENIFLPYERYQRLLGDNLDDISIFDIISKIGGTRPSRTASRAIEAVRATADQANHLQIASGDPLLYLSVYFTGEDDEPICIGRQYYVGSRYRFIL